MNKIKKKRKLSERYLIGATYRYLERYATTEANLILILKRKVEKIIVDDENQEELRKQSASWIKDIVAKALKQGLVDDKLYAQSRVQAFLQAGNSLSTMQNKLRAKGVSAEVISAVISKLNQEKPNINIISGIKYVKRRRFGAFRIKEAQENTEQKEMAAMARAGFSFKHSKKVLSASREELEDILYEN
jgi:regulatory protein